MGHDAPGNHGCLILSSKDTIPKIMKVEVYSDVACPWCYIGERRFARALSAFPQADDIEVVFRPFQLDPTLPEEPQPLKEQLAQKFGPRLDAMLQQTTATAKQEGLDFRFDRAQSVNTLTAHRLLWLAEREAGTATQRALAEKLFEAHFTDGENVGDPELLADLAASVGMDRKRVAAFLASHEGTSEVQQTIAHAQSIGVRAVPTFVFGGTDAVQGAQPASTFLEALETIYREKTSAASNGTSDGECADGSCST